MLYIYHNTRCRISRQVLDAIYNSGQEVKVREYLKYPPSVKELKILMIKLNLNPFQLVRQNEELFKKKFKGKKFTDEEWLQILHENPILIERPIVIKNNKAIVCRPPERIEEII